MLCVVQFSLIKWTEHDKKKKEQNTSMEVSA